jgi:hypothetical protein
VALLCEQWRVQAVEQQRVCLEVAGVHDIAEFSPGPARDPHFGGSGGVRAGTVLLATIWAVVFCVSLSRSLFDPIGYDQAFWQYVTERVMAGERMYVDVWDQNAPGVLGIHALSTWLVGRSPLACGYSMPAGSW